MAELDRYRDAELSLIRSFEMQPNTESLAIMGYIHASKNERREAVDLIEKMESFDAERGAIKVYAARIYLTLGEKERGYSLLEQVIEERCTDLIGIGVEPGWNSVRHEPRFLRIVEKVGLNGNRQT